MDLYDQRSEINLITYPTRLNIDKYAQQNGADCETASFNDNKTLTQTEPFADPVSTTNMSNPQQYSQLGK
jgi:hypothetical protein